jgi:hypothetical protein
MIAHLAVRECTIPRTNCLSVRLQNLLLEDQIVNCLLNGLNAVAVPLENLCLVRRANEINVAHGDVGVLGKLHELLQDEVESVNQTIDLVGSNDMLVVVGCSLDLRSRHLTLNNQWVGEELLACLNILEVPYRLFQCLVVGLHHGSGSRMQLMRWLPNGEFFVRLHADEE